MRMSSNGCLSRARKRPRHFTQAGTPSAGIFMWNTTELSLVAQPPFQPDKQHDPEGISDAPEEFDISSMNVDK
jgi:hypothetical protein